MKTFLLFFKNFLVCTFQNKASYIIHFVVPIVGFTAMFFLLSINESAVFAGTQAIGLVLYYTMIQACMIITQILKDKEQGVTKRITISPIHPLLHVAGNGAAAFLILSVQVLILSSFITFIFPVDIGLGYVQLLVILAAYSVTCIGFGFFVCSICETSSSAMMVANFVIMFSSLMGGAFFPVDYMSPTLQRLAIAFPQFWVMKALLQTQSGGSLLETGLSLLILLLFGVLFIVVQSAIKSRKKIPL